MKELLNWFKQNNKAAIAFSGGTDSSLVWYAALEAGADVKAYMVKSEFQPKFELEDAKCVEKWLGEKGLNPKFEVLYVSALEDENITSNPDDRCYYCKRLMMQTVREAAERDGYELLVDGTNASDAEEERPGMRATGELGVRSPLRELGCSKQQIRRLAEDAGLPTADKPAYACLATRIRTGEAITADKLSVSESAEAYLYSLGFRDFRVRMQGEDALIQVRPEQEEKLAAEFEAIECRLGAMYSHIRRGIRK